jgi:repressor LexA
MHPIQEQLLALSRRKNLAKLSLRQMAEEMGVPDASPQKIKHHLMQLQKKGFLLIDRPKGIMERGSHEPAWAKGLVDREKKLLRIPIIGTANCGPATIFAEPNYQGFLRVSSKLAGVRSPDGIYAIKADGSSMNRADLGGRKIEDGDYVIVDSKIAEPKNNDIVVAIIDNNATIKRFIKDDANEQIVLMADSSQDYSPIFLHPDDAFTISGKVICVVKRPKQ